MADTHLDSTSYIIEKLNALKDSFGAAASGIKFHIKTLTLDTALTDADTQQSVSLATADDGTVWPDNTRPIAAYAVPLTTIAGTDITILTVAIGDADNTDELFEETDLIAMPAGTWNDAPGAYTPWTLEASAYVPVAEYTATGANVAAATGRMLHVLVYWKLGKPESLA